VLRFHFVLNLLEPSGISLHIGKIVCSNDRKTMSGNHVCNLKFFFFFFFARNHSIHLLFYIKKCLSAIGFSCSNALFLGTRRYDSIIVATIISTTIVPFALRQCRVTGRRYLRTRQEFSRVACRAQNGEARILAEIKTKGEKKRAETLTGDTAFWVARIFLGSD